VIVNAPYNLDFAQGTNGWDAWENSSFSYVYSIDTSVKASGEGSLYLHATNELAEGQVSLNQGISVEAYRGKRVRIRGLIKAQNIVTWGGLRVFITGAGGRSIFNSNLQQEARYPLGIIGSHDWREYEIVFNVPTRGAHIHYGIGLMGQGHIWLDHLSFEIVSPDVPVTVRQ
ncbi:MAG TPA: hypothetical protein VGN34_00935, partial [Ktedonobacteraceae bacterium]